MTLITDSIYLLLALIKETFMMILFIINVIYKIVDSNSLYKNYYNNEVYKNADSISNKRFF